MPKLLGMSMEEMNKTLHGFSYTNVSIDKLGASEYTIVQMVSDQSGSVSAFKADLENMLSVSFDACKKSARSENLLYRATAFSSKDGGIVQIKELLGFTLLDQIDPTIFKGSLSPNGGTPLFDATMEAVDALYSYGGTLYKKKFLCNAILFVLTDGDDNASKFGPDKIREMLGRVRSENIVESFRTILIGVNDKEAQLKSFLDRFKNEAGLDEYISMGDVTPGKLAKLAQFVSQSVSSQSKSLGSGAGSTPLPFVF